MIHLVTLTAFDVPRGAGFTIYPLKAAGVFAFIVVVIAAVFALLHVRKVTLLWGNKTEKDLAFKEELENHVEDIGGTVSTSEARRS